MLDLLTRARHGLHDPAKPENQKTVPDKVDELYKWHLIARDQISKMEERGNWVLRLIALVALMNGWEKFAPLIAKAFGG